MLRIGIGQRDITPGRDLGLMGYAFHQQHFGSRNEGVRDPLRLKALLLWPEGQAPAAIVCLDLCIVSAALARRFSAKVAELAETTPDRVLVATSHTHSGPDLKEREYRDPLAEMMPAAFVEEEPAAAAYIADLETALAAAVAEALADPFPTSLRGREAPLGLGYRRRVMTDDGIDHAWNLSEQTHLEPDPQVDPLLSLVKLRELDGDRQALLWSHGCHPVVLGKGNNLVSADWVGAANALVEAALPGAVGFFLLGAAGDTHPWIATQNRGEGVEAVGETAGTMVRLLAAAGGASERDPAFAAVKETVAVGAIEVDLSAWRLGPCRLVAAPVEAFASLGLMLRKALPGPLIFATCANGWTCYWGDEAACAEGGYEIDGGRHFGREDGDGEKLVEALVKLACQLD